MVRIRHLHFGYSRRQPLYQDLSLDLERGHIYGLLGKNGAGKSTLLKNLVGLAFPQQGECLVDGRPAAARRPETLENLFFLPDEQDTPPLTAEQAVAYTGGFYPRFSAEEFYRHLAELEVPRQKRLDQLSHGQQKKFRIAFALAANTGLLVMDEPTNGLDIPSKAQFRRLMAGALSEERCLILSTHQVRDLDALMDTVLIVDNGRLVLNRPVDELAEQLRFTVGGPVDAPGALYTEASARGPLAIYPATEAGGYSRVDMELLFNALVSGNTAVLAHLNAPQPHHAPLA